MAQVITLTGLSKKSRLAGKNKCTTVRVFSRVEDRELMVCQEDIVEEKPAVLLNGIDNGLAESVSEMPYSAPSKRPRGRPRGSSPSNSTYTTRKGRRAKAPTTTFCPRENRHWVTATVGGGKQAKRCRCNAPGNSRFLPNRECE